MSVRHPKLSGRSWIALLLVLLGIGYFAWRFGRNSPVVYDDIIEHYKYGSLGSEAFSPPFWIWKALPVVFSEYLPGEGYASLGFIFERDREVPIGFSQRRLSGFDGIGLNCTFCHTGTVRDSAEADGRSYFRHDTNVPGNSNGGHLYGTNLSPEEPEEKEALVEYMKTL